MLVYLFELDSVIQDKELIKLGQYCLFEEIFVNGNTVILSMNQFTDSAIIYNLINRNNMYDIFLSLFKKGILKINPYGEITSTSMYVQQSIEKALNDESEFIFSNLPVKKENKELLNVVKKSLQYSDLTPLNNYANEYNMEQIEYIKKFVTLVLEISLEEKTKITPKYLKELNFDTIFEKINKQLNKYSNQSNIYNFKKLDKFKEAWAKIEELGLLFRSKNEDNKFSSSRAEWFIKINESNYDSIIKSYCYEIINLFYNFTIQDSINDVKYNYYDEESFFYEFVSRFEKQCNYINTEKTIDTENIQTFTNEKLNWARLNRLLKYLKFENTNITRTSETDIIKPSKHVLTNIIKGTFKNIFYFLSYILFFIFLEIIFSTINIDFIINKISIQYIKLTFEIIILGLISSIVSNILNIPDILESFQNILTSIIDLVYYLYFKSKISTRCFRRGNHENER